MVARQKAFVDGLACRQVAVAERERSGGALLQAAASRVLQVGARLIGARAPLSAGIRAGVHSADVLGAAGRHESNREQ